MRRSSKFILGGVLVLPLTGMMALPASATTAAPHAPSAGAGPATAPTLPHTKIATGNAFKPATLKGVVGVKVGCAADNTFSFTIVNSTKTSQQVTYNGTSFGTPLLHGDTLFVCLPGEGKSGTKATTWTFGLSGSSAVLTVKEK